MTVGASYYEWEMNSEKKKERLGGTGNFAVSA
jgi:hypothetical protein